MLASHHTLNYKIDEKICRGKDGINCSDYYLFSPPYTLTNLQSTSIQKKELWLEEVSLAQKEYVEPDDEITRQATLQRNQMQAFLNTAGPFVPTPPRDRPVAIQDNRITNEVQRRAAINFFGPPAKRTRVTPIVTTTNNLQQQTLFDER